MYMNYLLNLLFLPILMVYGLNVPHQMNSMFYHSDEKLATECAGATYNLVTSEGEIVGTATLSYDETNFYITYHFEDDNWVLSSSAIEVSKNLQDELVFTESRDRESFKINTGGDAGNREWKQQYELSSASLQKGDDFYLNKYLVLETGDNYSLQVHLEAQDTQADFGGFVRASVESCENKQRIMRRSVRW